MKKKMAALLLGVSFLLSGCSYSQTGIDALLAPPKLSAQQNEIYSALVAGSGKNVKLVYPRTGSYTSAFLVENIDSEPTEEALVFYAQQTAGSGSSSVRINVLDQRDGKWRSTYDAGGAPGATEIEKIDFITINRQSYIVIGYNLTSSADKMCVLYAFEDGRLTEKQRWNCANYIVNDLNDDGADEILTITSKKDASGINSTLAELRRITNTGGSQIISSVELDPVVTEYKYITPGRLRNGRRALYLDGVRGSNIYTTEILVCEGQRMDNLIYSVGQTELIEKTTRPSGTPSIDINDDNIVEIPVQVTAPGYENIEASLQEFFTEWYVYDEESLTRKKTTYTSYSLGYLFTIPEEWLGRVTVYFESASNELTFYSYSLTNPTMDGSVSQEQNNEITFISPSLIAEFGEKLLSIKAVRAADYEKEAEAKGYSLLEENGQIMYAYQIHENATSIRINPQMVKSGFQLYKF